MGAPLLPQLRLQLIDGNGAPYAGAKLNVYLAGTTTATDSYADSTLATPNANPVVADSAGRFGSIYLNPAITYKFVATTALGGTIFTQDNVTLSGSQIFMITTAIAGTTTLLATTGGDQLVLADASAGAVTIAFYTAVGYSGQKITVVKVDNSTNTVTCDPNGSQTLNGATTQVLSAQYEGLACTSNGSNWIRFGIAATVDHWLSKSADYVVAQGDGDQVAIAMDATAGAKTVTTYAAAGNKGRQITVKKIDSSVNTVTVDGNGAETIDGALTVTLRSQYNWVVIESDGANWMIVAQTPAPVTPYAATLANVLNTAALTTFLSFTIPSMADGDLLKICVSVLVKNAKGTNGTGTISFAYGATTVSSGVATVWTNDATEYKQLFEFYMQRVGSDLWIFGTSGTINPQFAPWRDPSGSTLATETIVMVAPTFTSSQTFAIKMTFSAADAAFYLKPQSALVHHQKVAV